MLLYIIIILLISNALNLRKDKSINFSRTTLTMFSSIWNYASIAYLLTGLTKGIGHYGGIFHITNIGYTFSEFMYFLTGLTLTITSFYPLKFMGNTSLTLYSNTSPKLKNSLNYIKQKSEVVLAYLGESFKIIEYSLVIAFAIMGGVLLIASYNYISAFLSIELQSYALYILCALYRNSEKATQAALTYFLLGGLSSTFILLGTSMIYLNSGSSSIEDTYITSTIQDNLRYISNVVYNHLYNVNYLVISFIIASVGFLFKVGAAPFHFWSPDVYDAIPTKVTAFVAVIAKISILVFLFELVFNLSKLSNLSLWIETLLTSSLLCLIIGSILGLTQSRIKRMYAYSTINHLGYIILALCISSVSSIQAFIFYIIMYSLTNLSAFFILLAIGYSLYLYVYKDLNHNDNTTDKDNSPIQLINQIKGYFHTNSWLSLSLSFNLFSFVGIPPLVGFFGKQMVLSSALNKGYNFITLIAILTSAIGAAYYLNVVKIMFFFQTIYTKFDDLIKNKLFKFHLSFVTYNPNENYIVLANPLVIIISVFTLSISLFMLMPGELFNIGDILTIKMFLPFLTKFNKFYLSKTRYNNMYNYISKLNYDKCINHLNLLFKALYKWYLGRLVKGVILDLALIIISFLGLSILSTIGLYYFNFDSLNWIFNLLKWNLSEIIDENNLQDYYTKDTENKSSTDEIPNKHSDHSYKTVQKFGVEEYKTLPGENNGLIKITRDYEVVSELDRKVDEIIIEQNKTLPGCDNGTVKIVKHIEVVSESANSDS